MSNIDHKTLGYAQQHVSHFKEYANAAARVGASGLATTDDLKIALQTDDNSLWILTDYSGPTWVHVGLAQADSITGAMLTNDFLPGLVIRSQFDKKDADEIYLSSAVYHHEGTTEQFVYWNSKLTFKFGSAGSNAASDNLAASKWFYLFLDDSAIVTQGSDLLDADCFLAKNEDNVTIAYNEAKHGHYETTATNDRCIGGFLTDGSSNILQFFHQGEFFEYGLSISDLVATDVDTTPLAVALTMPCFAREAEISFKTSWVDEAGSDEGHWRTKGHSGAGHIVGIVNTNSRKAMNTFPVITNSDNEIEVSMSQVSNDTVQVSTDGWYFPPGM